MFIKMSEKGIESSGPKLIPVVVQSEGIFNAGIILNESNYDVWSQLMEMHIAEREKLSYIRCKMKQPAESEDGYEKWYAENQKVKRWLLMFVTPEIMKRYLRLPTAHEIWSALSKAFYDGRNELQVFAINQKAFTSKQNGKLLYEYYEELAEIFRELDHRDKEPVPGLEECHALIRRVAVRRATLKDETGNSEAAAMPGHTKDRWYELVGYLEWWDHSRSFRKRKSKKTPTAAVAEKNIGDDAVIKGSALVTTTNVYGPLHKNPFLLQMDIKTKQTIGCDIRREQGKYQKGIQTLDYDIVTYDYDKSDAKIDTEKGDVNSMTLDIDSHFEAEEVPESQDASSSLKKFESLTNTPHQSSIENVPILEPELPRKQLPERLTRDEVKVYQNEKITGTPIMQEKWMETVYVTSAQEDYIDKERKNEIADLSHARLGHLPI
ncbi:hypothetical protein ACH5RR_041315 [Cinchona calisaya]|uniref:Retrotransposon Copia-like N-terminal domain-containing protein n=1 Tax=Cinchona calisaya TaxID=153742 RepID=A0ABD2XU13_9GENT